MTSPTLPILLDGYTDLPAGKLANVVTFMERQVPPSGAPFILPEFTTRKVDRPSTSWYRDIYRRIGENWLWFSRAVMSDDQLSTLLDSPTTTILSLECSGKIQGLAELDATAPGEIEIVTFGVLEEMTGTGAARMLMDAVLREAFRPGISRLWLHTCTFDHPAAIRFYQARGFTAYKFAIEVSDDPRLTGALPETAAPHVPLIRRSGTAHA